MTTVSPEVDALDSVSSTIRLSDGLQVDVQRLQTRQLMKALRILTAGAGDVLATLRFSAEMEVEEFTGQALGALLMAIPEAENETVEFLRSMVLPTHMIKNPRSAQEKEANKQMLAQLDELLQNPPIEDTISILEVAIQVEAPHLLALGKRMASIIRTLRPTATSKTLNDSSENEQDSSTRLAS